MAVKWGWKGAMKSLWIVFFLLKARKERTNYISFALHVLGEEHHNYLIIISHRLINSIPLWSYLCVNIFTVSLGKIWNHYHQECRMVRGKRLTYSENNDEGILFSLLMSSDPSQFQNGYKLRNLEGCVIHLLRLWWNNKWLQNRAFERCFTPGWRKITFESMKIREKSH